MSTSARRKAVSIRFSDFSGGVNLSEDSTRIGRNQVQYSLNAILRKNGLSRRPGSTGKPLFDLTGLITGFYNYLNLTGTERKIACSGGKIYSLAATGAATERFSPGGSGKFSFATSLGKVFATNGTKACKGEGDTWSQIGIAAPTGASAAASNSASGTLPAGTYEVYVGYAREVSGTFVLYSTGQYLGAISVVAPNDSITISNFALSTDTQVTHRVVWMSDANLSTIYRYATVANTGSTTVVVENDSAKTLSILYSVAAANNAAVPAFKYLHAGDGRLWGSVGNRLHYSLRNTSNAYDLERFFPLNFIDFPHEITGIFSVGENLYVNTPAGIYVQPGHDVTARTVWVEKRWRFAYMGTVVDHNGGKLGLTNDGVKFFDGEKFYDYDISEAVKSEITKMYDQTAGFEPVGLIIRRDIRTEYHICYNDRQVNAVTNNRRLVLNLDRLGFQPDKTVTAPWELWTNACTHMVTEQGGTPYFIQSHATAPKFFIEDILTSVDNGIYLDDGTVGSSTSNTPLEVQTRTELLDMSARCSWNILRTMAVVLAPFTIQLFIRDVENRLSNDSAGAGAGVAAWDAFDWDVGTWASSAPTLRKTKLPMNLRGYMVFAKIMQEANDPTLNILDTTVEGVATMSRFT